MVTRAATLVDYEGNVEYGQRGTPSQTQVRVTRQQPTLVDHQGRVEPEQRNARDNLFTSPIPTYVVPKNPQPVHIQPLMGQQPTLRGRVQLAPVVTQPVVQPQPVFMHEPQPFFNSPQPFFTHSPVVQPPHPVVVGSSVLQPQPVVVTTGGTTLGRTYSTTGNWGALAIVITLLGLFILAFPIAAIYLSSP